VIFRLAFKRPSNFQFVFGWDDSHSCPSAFRCCRNRRRSRSWRVRRVQSWNDTEALGELATAPSTRGDGVLLAHERAASSPSTAAESLDRTPSIV
ncbi:hypothetical protein PRIPAC_83823, partial [Pristionchus pacificus]|uniref:Uncharacterized protein n=1 Tax=Pristionchus pacificus TaxID=54126 RepID=A0A2A6BT68_PRIPA